MARIIEPFEQFFDGDGDPLINGWLKFTESGTNLTDKDTFADVNLSIANTNPLQLDSEGRCPNVFGSGSYRVTLYMDDGAGAPGIQIDQKDPVGAGTTGVTFPEWAELVEYSIDEIVAYDGNYYKSRVNTNTGNQPDTSPTQWEQIDFIHIYNANIEYSEKESVVDPADGYTYISLVDNNTGNTPSSSPSEWRGGKMLLSANDLSDVDSAATSRTNLDVYSKSETDTEISTALDNIYPVGSVIEYYGAFNPNTLVFADTGDTVDSSAYPLTKPVLPAVLTTTVRTAAGSYTGDIEGIAYGNSIWVFVGHTGEIQTSPDGITWTQRTAAGSYTGNFSNAYFGDGLFVALGATGEIQTSPDGITWTQRTAAGSYTGAFNDGVFADSLHVIVGETGEIQTSPDGITWTQRTAAGSYTGIFTASTHGDSTFVIVGQTGEIQTSPDGTTWTQRTAAGSFTGIFLGAAYGNDIFVIVGVGGEIQTSPDGITWTQRAAGGGYSANFEDVHFGDEIFIAVGAAGGLQPSPDGVTWTDATTSGGLIDCYVGGSGGETFIGVGSTALIRTADTSDRTVPVFASVQTGFTQFMKIG